jgi:hypothetical protein
MKVSQTTHLKKTYTFPNGKHSCKICGSDNGDCKDYCVLSCNFMQYNINLQMFRENFMPPSSAKKNTDDDSRLFQRDY